MNRRFRTVPQNHQRRLSLGELVTYVDELTEQLRDHGPMDSRERDLVIPLLAQPASVAGVRQRIGRHLTVCGLAAAAGTAELCVSELLTNTIVHVGIGTPVVLRLLISTDRLRIELTDPDPRGLPALLSPTTDTESGRGLALLDALALNWGTTQHPDGKTVWCELGE